MRDHSNDLPPMPLDAGHWQAIVAAMGLSLRQSEIAELLVRGASVKQIAAALDIADSTIRTQQERILTKAGARSRSELHLRILDLSHRVIACPKK